jgi:hypothetical protein
MAMLVPLSVPSWFMPDHPNQLASRIQLQKEIEEIKLEDRIKTAKSPKIVKELRASLQRLQQGRAEIHETTRLDKFLQDAKDPDKCGNILDRMNISSGDRPWFIWFVSLSFQSFTTAQC